MTVAELSAQIARMEQVQTDTLDFVKDLNKAIRGNGQPGLLDRVRTIETRQIDCPARDASRGDARRTRLEIAVAIVSAMAAIAACLVAIRA